MNETTVTQAYDMRCKESGRVSGEVDADRPSLMEDRKRSYEVVADAPSSVEGRRRCYEVKSDTTRSKAMQ